MSAFGYLSYVHGPDQAEEWLKRRMSDSECWEEEGRFTQARKPHPQTPPPPPNQTPTPNSRRVAEAEVRPDWRRFSTDTTLVLQLENNNANLLNQLHLKGDRQAQKMDERMTKMEEEQSK
ncbi:hypothetical protein COLO4_27872 [Corchorus olitorius]|uniref:Uncharacterized protein n=1 Tax=Corchorus olitorius TaxID=93759 RepID=A0A1R3HNS5_9ROSI|nr:hypothetical protein COLO4_27872 [Corchorus olitorius]